MIEITKGDWTMVSVEEGEKDTFLTSTGEYQIRHGKHTIIAIMGKSWADGAAEANAQLIASAPKLYVELVEADEVICGLCKRLNPQHENCTSCEEREYRLKAIALAEGK